MKRTCYCFVVLCSYWLIGVSASGQNKNPPLPPPIRPAPPIERSSTRSNVETYDVGNLRLSALMGSEPKLFVGLVDVASSNVYVLRKGDHLYGYELVSIDYDREEVGLEKNEERITLRLRGDPNATNMFASTARTMGPPPVSRITTLEDFLAAYPQAQAPGGMKIGDATSQRPVQGMGEGIESYLKEHPELAKLTNEAPQGSLGPGIESMLQGMSNVDREALMKPAVGLGEGIESYLKDHPELGSVEEFRAAQKPKTYEEFLKEHPELNQQNSQTMPLPKIPVSKTSTN